jgi:hypothetical protein
LALFGRIAAFGDRAVLEVDRCWQRSSAAVQQHADQALVGVVKN